MTWLPPSTNGTMDDWHVLIVRNADPDDSDYFFLHPDTCPVGVSTQRGVHYECQTQYDVDCNGTHGLFEGDNLEVGVWMVHPWVAECRGLDWVEYDGGWTVIQLTDFELRDKLTTVASIAFDAALNGLEGS